MCVIIIKRYTETAHSHDKHESLRYIGATGGVLGGHMPTQIETFHITKSMGHDVINAHPVLRCQLRLCSDGSTYTVSIVCIYCVHTDNVNCDSIRYSRFGYDGCSLYFITLKYDTVLTLRPILLHEI